MTRDSWLLGRFDRNLADVSRWAIVRTIRTQSVAEHSFYVALVTTRLLRRYGVNDPDKLLAATEYALTHDLSEVLTGDVATPAKKRLPAGVFDALEAEFGMTPAKIDSLTVQAIKVADLFEAATFLCEEIAMGNARVVDILRIIKKKLDHACSKFEDLAGVRQGLYRDMSSVLHDLQFSKVDPLEPEEF